MKLPRWLSPVRTVEAETGWPRAVCKDFAAAVAPRFNVGRYAMLLALLVVWLPPGGALLGGTLIALDGSAVPKAVRALVIVLVLAAVAAPYAAGISAIFASEARRCARSYLPAPWCFKCKYPIPPPREGRSYSICPECGEPIPPEIATLAAERDTA